MKIEHIIKRDFTTSPFHLNKITEAIQKAMSAVGVGTEQNAHDVAFSVNQKLLDRKKEHQEYIPTIEEVQDIVETQLMESKFPETAKAYILYRNKRSQQRESDLFEKRINLNRFSVYLWLISLFNFLIPQVLLIFLSLQYLLHIIMHFLINLLVFLLITSP